MESAFESVRAQGAHEMALGFRRVLALLLQAYDYAEDLRCSVWEFAVEIAELKAAGVTNNDLRWLARHGYVDLATETTKAGSRRRCFSPAGGHLLTARTCFVLTPDGVTLAQHLGAARERMAPLSPARESAYVVVPVWDAERRELRLGGVLVKKFRRPAGNQELILAVFQEEGWPARIDDPLPSHDGRDGVERLHFTISRLNRNQETSVLHFCGDGTGRGVGWEAVRAIATGLPPDRHLQGNAFV